MRFGLPCSLLPRLCLAALLAGLAILPASADQQDRRTPLVRAIESCSPSVVNLRGRKTVADTSSSGSAVKQVNGMGTGIVIDPRGYLLTNYHVVEGVRTIQVTTCDGTQTTAKLLAHDHATDLAILKIDIGKPLPVIKIGSSSDLMLAETVAAVGNAYGYEHTVTVGIISQLGRTVQVNEDQIYDNLIQTDAPINPGNSGGPLLNLNGEMIGINVAVRIGAQGIAFAIPVNDALETAARLMDEVVADTVFHGIETKTEFVDHQPQLRIESVAPDSPAAKAGLAAGDRLVQVGDIETRNALDFRRSLLGLAPGNPLAIKLTSGEGEKTVQLELSARPTSNSSIAWDTLGLKLDEVPANEMVNRHPSYSRGLRVTRVRSGSPADREGILEGDILVAMHGWKTESLANLAYILNQQELKQASQFMFYILRDKEPFWGQMRLASRPR